MQGTATQTPNQLPPPYTYVTNGTGVQPQAAPQYQPQGAVPVFYQQANTKNERYSGRSSIILGAFQSIFGALSIAVNSVGLGVGMGMGVVGHGFWGGLFFIISGTLGYGAGKHKSPSVISAHLGMSIMSILAALGGIGVTGTGIWVDIDNEHCEWREYDWEWVCFYDTNIIGLILNIFLLLLMVGEAVVALWACVLCCSAGACSEGCCACCCVTGPNHAQPQMYVASPPGMAFGQPASLTTTIPNYTPQMVLNGYQGAGMMQGYVNNSNNNNNNNNNNGVVEGAEGASLETADKGEA